jgi:microcystin-dependent protein
MCVGDESEETMSRMSFLKDTAYALAIGFGVLGAPASAQEPLLGEIRFVSFNFVPKGWASCDGQLLSINQNQALFSLLLTTYGGNGQTNFALPDMRGRVPIHVGMGPGLTERSRAEAAGAETYALTTGELPAHDHPAGSHAHDIPALTIDLVATSAAATSTSAAGNVLATTTSGATQKAATQIYAGGAANLSLGASGTTVPGTTGAAAGTIVGMTGEGAAHPTMPPFFGARCIIATTGIFPQQP